MILIKPSLQCNLKCSYCYEHPCRDRDKEPPVDLPKILDTIEKADDLAFCLHGGEPLILPIETLEAICKKVFEKKGTVSMQTNGLNVTPEVIKLFKDYSIHVGISIDGNGLLNKFRCNETITNKILNNIDLLKKENISLGLIIVVSQANAGDNEKLQKLKEFMSLMYSKNIKGRINPCITFNPKFDLSPQRTKEVYLDLLDFCLQNGQEWSPFRDMWKSLLNDQNVVCIFKGCDIFHTHSCSVLLGDGFVTNCMRVSAKDIYQRDKKESDARNQVLQQISQDNNGCQKCEFWYACHGGCPTQSEDWRSRTILCEMYKAIFLRLKSIQSSFSVKSIESNNIKQKNNTKNIQVCNDKNIEHLDGNVRHLDSCIKEKR